VFEEPGVEGFSFRDAPLPYLLNKEVNVLLTTVMRRLLLVAEIFVKSSQTFDFNLELVEEEVAEVGGRGGYCWPLSRGLSVAGRFPLPLAGFG
jgi:hypothetical protein